MSGFEAPGVTIPNPAIEHGHASARRQSGTPLAEATGGNDPRVKGAAQELIERARRKSNEEKEAVRNQLELEDRRRLDYLAVLDILDEIEDMFIPGEIEDPVNSLDPPRWKSRGWKEALEEVVARFRALELNKQANKEVVKQMFDDMLRSPNNAKIEAAKDRYREYLAQSEKRLEKYATDLVEIEARETTFQKKASPETA